MTSPSFPKIERPQLRWLSPLLVAPFTMPALSASRLAVVGGPAHNAFVPVAGELGMELAVSDRPKPEDFDALLVCAPDYPKVSPLTDSTREAMEQFLAAGKSVYVEYTPLPGLVGDQPQVAGFERIFVVANGRATEGLSPLTILEEHSSCRLPFVAAGQPEGGRSSVRPLLSYGWVAGVDKAVFGPPTETAPALVEIERGKGRLLLATTALSNFLRSRCKPMRTWRTLARSILLSLLPSEEAKGIQAAFIDAEAWTEPREWAAAGEPVLLYVRASPSDLVSVSGSAGRVPLGSGTRGVLHSQPLFLPAGRHTFRVAVRRGGAKRDIPVTVEVSARLKRYGETVARNLQWFQKADLLITPEGDRGVREGLTSALGPEGKPTTTGALRVDCVSECALAFYLYGQVAGDRKWLDRGRRMMGYVAHAFQVTTRDSWYFGHWQSRGEFCDEGSAVYTFNDDSGAATLFSLLGYAASGNRELLEAGLRGVEYFCHVASERTGLLSGVPHRNYGDSGPIGVPWPSLRGQNIATGSPHVLNLPLASLLVAYQLTGEKRYLSIAERGIRTLMTAYPHWEIVTSRTCEHTRMLLPLALVVTVAPSSEHRKWLDVVVNYLLGKQAPCGALQEWDGRNPKSNAEFGTLESSVFQENGDPVSDQLYNTGFAVFHLWLAYKATGDARIRRAFERLADFATRIQMRSEEPLHDGTWLRAFDYERWEYWGSSADVGWGPYCSETGWMCGPMDLGLLLCIAANAARREPRLSLVPVHPNPKLREMAEAARREADEVEAALSAPPTTIEGLHAVASRGPYAQLTWTVPANRHFSYNVYRAQKPDFAPASDSLAGRTYSGVWIDTSLQTMTDYFYRVVATNGLGQSSPPCASLKVRTGPPSQARGRRYSKSLTPHVSYPDTGEGESTDAISAGAYADGKSYGYRLEKVGDSVSLDITVDLGAEVAIARASHHNCGAPGYRPDEMTVAVSVDGKSWTRLAATTEVLNGLMIVDFPESPARFLRFHFTKQRHGVADDWLFIDEVEAF